MTTIMGKTRIVLGTLLIFALGALAGFFGGQMYFKYRIERMYATGEPPPVVEMFMKRLSDNLDLTEEQKREIEVIVRQSHKRLRKIKNQYRPQIKGIIDETFVEIEKTLDEKQKQDLQEFRKRFRFFSRHKHHPGALPHSHNGSR